MPPRPRTAVLSPQARLVMQMAAAARMRELERGDHRSELAERLTSSLTEFIRAAWHVVEPTTELIWGRHIDAICEHLEAVADGRIRRLLVNIPPGHMKSKIVSVFWPAWMWLRNPSWRVLTASYAQDLSNRDSVYSRDLITSPWYLETFRPKWKMKSDQNVKSYYENDARGMRLAISVGSKVTGFRGDGVIVDDPLNARDKASVVALAEAEDFVTRIIPTRINDPRTGFLVVVMQVLCDRDPTAALVRAGGWERVCLPSEYDPDRRSSTCIGWSDWRSEPGEMLFPEMFTRDVLSELRRTLGAVDYENQHQQRGTSIDLEGAKLHGLTKGDRVVRHFAEEFGVAPGQAYDRREIIRLAIAAGWKFTSGWDHGKGTGREVAVLIAYHDTLKRLYVLDAYSNPRRTTPQEDARGFRRVLDDWGVSPMRVVHSKGDVNDSGLGSVDASNINAQLQSAKDEDEAPILGFSIGPADKSAGSVNAGVDDMNAALYNGRMFLDPTAVIIIEAGQSWTGGEYQKDPCDAWRYGCHWKLRAWQSVHAPRMVMQIA